MFLNCLAISGSKSAATGEEEVGDHIKHCIQESLEWIFEKQWQSEKVPEDWKEADGKAMIRGGEPVKEEGPGNCRMVSLTSVSGKVTKQTLSEVYPRIWKWQDDGMQSLSKARHARLTSF